MKNVILVSLVFVSLSSVVQAEVAFLPFTDDFKVVKNSKVEIEDMPALRSQDSLGICYASAAATLLNFENCRLNNKRTGKIVKCDTVPDDELFSSLGLARYGGGPLDSEKEEGLFSSFRSINIGGSITNTLLRGAYNLGSAPNEVCVSMDQVLSKVGGAEGKSAAQEAVWKQLEKVHSAANGQTAEESVKKYGGLIQKCLGIDVSNESLLRAFGEASYESFLDRILISPKCNRAKFNAVFEGKDTTELKSFPDEGKKTSYQDTIKKIQNVLQDGHPMALSNICLDENPKPLYPNHVDKQSDIPDGFCKESHAVVISGYKRVCAGKECYDAIKVVNSWGKNFQKKINNGWVKADSLLNRTTYEQNTLSWIQDLPPKK